MICRACGSTLRRHQNGLKCVKCHVWACSNACARDVVDLQCCRMTGVATHDSQSQSCSRGSAAGIQRSTSIGARHGAGDGRPDGGRADCRRAVRSATPRRTRANRAALQAVPTTLAAMVAVPMEVKNGQPMQIDLATPRAGQAEPHGSAQAPDPAAVFTWFEKKLLELATSLLAMPTIRHQPRGLRQRTCTILKKLLQHHTHCHHQWVKRRDPQSLQAEVAAARWAWLGPTLLVRAHEGSEQADGEELTWNAAETKHRVGRQTCNTGRNRRVDRALAHVRA